MVLMKLEAIKDKLRCILKTERNVDIIGKYIFNKSKTEEETISLLHETLSLIEQYNVKKAFKMIISNQTGFGHPEFSDMVRKQTEQDDYITSPPEVVEGVLKCHCGSERVYSFTQQTRGGDEGTSVWGRCVVCGDSWRASQ